MCELVTKSRTDRTEDRNTHRRATCRRLHHCCDRRRSARRPRRYGRLRTGQILAEIAERNRVFRFKGYEDWAVVSSARTDEVLKVIVGNPTMITAYKAGVSGNGQPFPEGPMIVKLQ